MGPNSGNDTNTGGPRWIRFEIVYPVVLVFTFIITFTFFKLLYNGAYAIGYKQGINSVGEKK